MKKIFLILFLILFSNILFAQNNDFIIRKDNDTTYCNIKRISNKKIYFIYNGDKKLYNKLSDISGYKQKDKKFVIVNYIPLTSKDIIHYNNSKNNDVFIELGGSSFFGFSFNYGRNFHLSENRSLSISIGAGYGSSRKYTPLFPVKIEFIWKRFELGIGATNYIYNGGSSNTYLFPLLYDSEIFRVKVGNKYSSFCIHQHPILGYRFINKKNFFSYLYLTSMYLSSPDWEGTPLPWIGIKAVYVF